MKNKWLKPRKIMANVDEILEVFDNDNSYFDEFYDSPITTGTYNAVIVALSSKMDTSTRKGDICDIYYPRYKIEAEEPEFGNRLVRDSGIFRYKSKVAKSRNIYYKRYLDKLNISLNKKEIEGKLRYLLPSLIPEMLANKKVVINVFTEEWSDGRGYHKIPVARLSHLQ